MAGIWSILRSPTWIVIILTGADSKIALLVEKPMPLCRLLVESVQSTFDGGFPYIMGRKYESAVDTKLRRKKVAANP